MGGHAAGHSKIEKAGGDKKKGFLVIIGRCVGKPNFGTRIHPLLFSENLPIYNLRLGLLVPFVFCVKF